jgi:hypothetical protein
MYYLSIAARFRNESHILKEWLEHYIHHGVEHFYLFNDYSDDNFYDILQPYINKQLVTLYDNTDIPRLKKNRQIHTYNKLFSIKEQTKWLSILDLDEFLWSPINIDLKIILKQYEHIQCIELSMIYFGNNNNIEQPQHVIPVCTKRCDWNNYIKFTKCLFQIDSIEAFGIHNMINKGITKNLSVTDDDPNGENCPFILNHYYIQSKYQFLRKKFCFQDETGGAYIASYDKYLEKYNDLVIRLNEIEDIRLYKQNASLYTLS